MRGSTFTLGPSGLDRQNTGKILLLFLSPFFLSLYPTSPLSIVCFPSSFLFLFSFSFLSLSTTLPSFLVCSYLIFLFIFHFFLFSPHSSFSYPYGSSWGNFPPLSSLATCHHHVFLTYFLYFSLLLHHVTHGSI